MLWMFMKCARQSRNKDDKMCRSVTGTTRPGKGVKSQHLSSPRTPFGFEGRLQTSLKSTRQLTSCKQRTEDHQSSWCQHFVQGSSHRDQKCTSDHGATRQHATHHGERRWTREDIALSCAGMFTTVELDVTMLAS